MARKMGRPTTGRDDVSVKLDRRVVGMAKLVAKAKGLSAAAYLSDLLLVQVGRDFADVMKELERSGR